MNRTAFPEPTSSYEIGVPSLSKIKRLPLRSQQSRNGSQKLQCLDQSVIAKTGLPLTLQPSIELTNDAGDQKRNAKCARVFKYRVELYLFQVNREPGIPVTSQNVRSTVCLSAPPAITVNVLWDAPSLAPESASTEPIERRRGFSYHHMILEKAVAVQASPAFISISKSHSLVRHASSTGFISTST